MNITIIHFLFVFVSICVFVLLYTVSNLTNESAIGYYNVYHGKVLIRENFTSTTAKSDLLFDHCELPQLDPWDPKINKFLDPNKNPKKNCKPSYKKLTMIVNNTVVMLPETTNFTCSYRCLLPKSGSHMTTRNWTKLRNNTKPLCDFIQIACNNSASNSTYKFAHALIFRDESQLPLPPLSKLPNVHIIVIDSTSKSNFERTMIRTKTFLRNHLKSQPMNYLNKIGENSRPNAMAFLLGKAVSTIQASSFSVGYKSDYVKDACRIFLDDDQLVINRYRDGGYVTMMAEDCAYTVFNYPNCKGFAKPLAQHFFKPFTLINEANHDYRKNVYEKQCKETYHPVIDYHQKFIETYPDRPIFSLTWYTYLGHDDINGLYRSDDYFYRLLRNNKEHFQNSYLFFMGDHGMRVGNIRRTDVGEVEDNNPFLWISVPENKRSDQLEQLRVNSEKLISHYDIYATLVELIEPTNATIPSPLIHGESLLSPLKEPRTCDRLRIPFEHCMCDFKKTKVQRNLNLTVKMATACVKRMNQELSVSNITSFHCSNLTLNTKAGVDGYRYRENGDQAVYKVLWKTTPGDGAFEAFILHEKSTEKFKIVSPKFLRSNAYRDQKKCIKEHHWESYCYCKDLLKGKKL